MSDYYSDLAAYVRSKAPAGFARATLTCKWHDGEIEGPAVEYFAASGQPVPSGWDFDESRDLGKLFRAQRESERKKHTASGGQPPNYFELVVTAGEYTPAWSFDAGAQAREEARMRQALGEAEYERLQQKAAPKPAAPPDEGGPMNVPELLGFIQEELAKDAPAGWKEIHVEGEVWAEGGMNNIRTVYYYTLPNDAQRRKFESKNLYGPMNAVAELQKRMASEGNAWRKVKLQYTAGTTRTLIDTQ